MKSFFRYLFLILKKVNQKGSKDLFNPKLSTIVFILVLIGSFFLFDYGSVLKLRPQAIHQWRQCDGLSITMNYYKDNYPFFEPQVHAQEANFGESGHAISEFPIVYYFIAQLWKIFGHHEWIFRLFSILMVFVGLFALFKTSELILKDSFYAGFLALLFLTSPVMVYYTHSFVPNTTAFSFLLIGWYFIFKYRLKLKQYFFFIGVLFFLLAALVKVTMAMSILCYVGFIFFNDVLRIGKSSKNKKITKNSILHTIIIVVALGFVFMYYKYARQYNFEHKVKIFSLQTWPIWSLSNDTIETIKQAVKDLWIDQYSDISVRIFIGICILVFLWGINKIKRLLVFMNITLLIGILAYISLWFFVFRDHDYYIIDLFIFLVFLLLASFSFLLEKWPKLSQSLIFKSILIIFLLYNLSLAGRKSNNRYKYWMNNHHKTYYAALEDITPHLRTLGLSRDTKVISVPDASFTITLYLMDQKGWTFGNDDPIIDLNKKIELGAEYLIINNAEWKHKAEIKDFLTYPVSTYKNIEIFDLRPYKNN